MMKRHFRMILVGCAISAAVVGHAVAADSIRVGLLLNTSGSIASIGKEVEMGSDLALKTLGGKLGGLNVQVFKEEAGLTPESGLQAVAKLIERNKVDVVIGPLLSNQIGALVKPVTQGNALMISPLGGPASLAGAECNASVFVTSWQNEMSAEALDHYAASRGFKRVSVVSHSTVVGKDSVAGFLEGTKAAVATEAYVPMGHQDYASEIAAIRAAKPDAVYVFAIGASAVAFVKQYAAAGLLGQIPILAGSYIADEHSFNALGDSALGLIVSGNWFADLGNAANKKFVEGFRKEYGRTPVFYAATTYDTIMLLDSAVRSVKGGIENRAAFRAALQRADFASVRGNFQFNTNNYPIQDLYIAKVVKKEGLLQHETMEAILKAHKDRYSVQCAMKK